MGIDILISILKQLTLVDVEYYSFDDKLHNGQLVVNKNASKEIIKWFLRLSITSRFPIAKVIPVVKYNWDDNVSMINNNTPVFYYRKVEGTNVLSAHSFGMAIDIILLQNPHRKGIISHPQSDNYDPNVKGTILRD